MKKILLLSLILPLVGWAQLPVRSYTFDDKATPFQRKNQTYLHFDTQQPGPAEFPFENARLFGVRFRLRMSEEWKGSAIYLVRGLGSVVILTPTKINFSTKAFNRNGEVVEDVLTLNLKGSGVGASGYLFNGDWHQLGFFYDPVEGKKFVEIDGEVQEGFLKNVDQRGSLCPAPPCTGELVISWGVKSRCIVGDVDDLNIYDRLPRIAKTSEPTENLIDAREYTPHHPHTVQAATQQLDSFPSPRYLPTHTLHRHFNWMDLQFFGGRTQEGISRDQARRNALAIQKHLVEKYHYALVLHNVKFARDPKTLRDTTNFYGALIHQANSYPNIPLGVTTLWAQVNPVHAGFIEKRAWVYGGNLSDRSYLQNKGGGFVDNRAQTSTRKWLSPIADEAPFVEDGLTTRFYLENLNSALTRPIDIINENGEVPPLPYSKKVLETDPRLKQAFEQSRSEDWDTWQAVQKNRFRMAYRDAFMDLPVLRNTAFTWYGVDGGPLDRFSWTEARKIGTRFNDHYYSTPDFYPRWPDNWEKWKGPWRGFAWLEASRKVEIEAGDELFSPFVAAGWDKNPEKNIRPSQWLGLLKHLPVIGAEFFYVGFFNVTSGKGPHSFAKPENYAWQAAMPAYAQAVASRFEDVLREGELLRDEGGAPQVRVWAGDPRVLMTVRKKKSEEVYILSANVNPISNVKGNVPDSVVATWQHNGQEWKFWARRQGSVYRLDLRDPEKPVVIQLDGWHEAGHPSWWSSDFRFEAEVFDQAEGISIHTEQNETSRAGDFRAFRTWVKGGVGENNISWQFAPVESHASTRLELQVRVRDQKKAWLEVWLDGKSVARQLVKGEDWHSVTMQLPGITKGAHQLKLIWRGTEIEIDRGLWELN